MAGHVKRSTTGEYRQLSAETSPAGAQRAHISNFYLPTQQCKQRAPSYVSEMQ
jgi:hypothetical protein